MGRKSTIQPITGGFSIWSVLMGQILCHTTSEAVEVSGSWVAAFDGHQCLVKPIKMRELSWFHSKHDINNLHLWLQFSSFITAFQCFPLSLRISWLVFQITPDLAPSSSLPICSPEVVPFLISLWHEHKSAHSTLNMNLWQTWLTQKGDFSFWGMQ